MSLTPYKVKLSEIQLKNLAKAYKNNVSITIRFKHNDLINGTNELMLNQTQINKIKKTILNKNTGMDLKISKSQIRKVIQRGGSLFTVISSIIGKLLPIVTKIAPKLASSALYGTIGSLASNTVDKIFQKKIGNGLRNRPKTGGIYKIPFNKMHQMENILNLLTPVQLKEYTTSLTRGSGFDLKMTQKQINGGFLGSLLASIGIPLIPTILKAIGLGMQNRRPNEKCNCRYGSGLKKKDDKT